MSVQTIALKCPNCGNSSNLAAKEVKLGYEFTCPFCSSTSIVVVNQQLYTPQAGELVCGRCGRVAPPNSRFCQCGASLVRKCSSCLRDFPITHQICDYCGQPQRDSLATNAPLKQRLDEAIRALSNPDARIRIDGCDELRTIGALAAPAIPKLLDLIEHDSHCRKSACQAIGAIGAAAKSAVPRLLKVIENDPWSLEAACAALGSIGDTEAIPALIGVIKDSSTPLDAQAAACRALAAIGDPAVPALIQVITEVPGARESACRALLWTDREAAQKLTPELAEIFINEPDSRLSIGHMLTQIGFGTLEPAKVIDLLLANDRDLDLAELNDAAMQTLAQDGNKGVFIVADKLKHHQHDIGALKSLTEALGVIGSPTAIQILVEAFKTLDNRPMHDLAANALIRVGARALPAVQDLAGFFASGDMKQEVHMVVEQIEYRIRKG